MANFFRRGRSAAFFIPTLATPAAPKIVTELQASGVDLTAAVTAITGFTTTVARIGAPVMKYPAELQISGAATYDDTTMTLLEDDGSVAAVGSDEAARQAAKLALAEGATGLLVLHPTKSLVSNFAAGDKVEVWQIDIGSNNRSWSLDAEMARYSVAFAITGKPIKNAVLAA